MAPPERTFGPIGWQGFFGDDESGEEEPSEEAGSPGADRPTTSGAEGPAGTERHGSDAGRDPSRQSDTETAIRDERAQNARELSASAGGSDREEEDPLDGWKTLDEISDEDRREREDHRTDPATERETSTAAAASTEDQGEPSTADAAEDRGIRDRIDDFYARYFLPPSVTDDGFGDEEPADGGDGGGGGSGPDRSTDVASGTDGSTGTGSSAGSGAASSTGTSGSSTPTGDTEETVEREAETDPSSRDESGTTAAAGAAGSTGLVGAGSTDRTGRDRADREVVENVESPRSEPRVRTSESGTVAGDEAAGGRETTSDDSEVTLGPIGLKGFGSDDEPSEAAPTSTRETSPTRRESSSTPANARGTTGPPETTRRRTGTGEEDEDSLLDRVPWSISLTAIAVGVGLLVFIDIVSMMVPLIAAIGAGIVGGFVAGYISGGPVRGGMHALAVGIIGGIAVGYLTALVGALIGLFLEPATLLGRLVGPITPDLGIFGAWGPLLVMVLVTVMIAIDATIAGAVGGTVRSMVDEVR